MSKYSKKGMPSIIESIQVPETKTTGWYFFQSSSVSKPYKMTRSEEVFYSLPEHEQKKTRALQKIAQQFESMLNSK